MMEKSKNNETELVKRAKKFAKEVCKYFEEISNEKIGIPKIAIVWELPTEDMPGFDGGYDLDRKEIELNRAFFWYIGIERVVAHEMFHYADHKLHGNISFPYEAGAYFAEFTIGGHMLDSNDAACVSEICKGLASFTTTKKVNVETAHAFFDALKNEGKSGKSENKSVEEIIYEAKDYADKKSYICDSHHAERLVALLLFFEEGFDIKKTMRLLLEKNEALRKELEKAVSNANNIRAAEEFIDAYATDDNKAIEELIKRHRLSLMARNS